MCSVMVRVTGRTLQGFLLLRRCHPGCRFPCEASVQRSNKHRVLALPCGDLHCPPQRPEPVPALPGLRARCVPPAPAARPCTVPRGGSRGPESHPEPRGWHSHLPSCLSSLPWLRIHRRALLAKREVQGSRQVGDSGPLVTPRSHREVTQARAQHQSSICCPAGWGAAPLGAVLTLQCSGRG